MSEPKSEPGHLTCLDALRGLLSFWVLAGHTAFCAGVTLPLLSYGALAVDVFMFISGLLMAYHYRLREVREPWESSATWIRFYIRRFFRIAPAYYLLLTIALVFRTDFQAALASVITSISGVSGAVDHLTATNPPNRVVDALLHFTFLFGLLPAYASNNALPDWSIGLEMQFYLAFPFIMLLYRRAGYLLSTVLLLAVCITSHQLFSVYDGSVPKLFGLFPQPSFLPLKLNCFIVGILVSEALHFRFSNPTATTLLLLGAFAVTLKGASWYFQGICLVACILMIQPPSADQKSKALAVINRMLNGRIVAFMADTSYGVYLVHNLVLIPVAAFFVSQRAFLSLPPLARFSLLLSAVALVTFPIAFLLFRYIETPGIALGRRILGQVRRDDRAPSVSQPKTVAVISS